MIGIAGAPVPAVRRLMSRLAPGALDGDSHRPRTLVLGADSVESRGIEPLLESHRGARVLVMSALGTHPDAVARRLRDLWAMEELARASGLPVLTLRLGPMVGPRSPLWLRLRSRPRLPDGGRALLMPAVEEDVLDALGRALDGSVEWAGWFEIVGPEPLTVEELARLAARTPPLAPGSGDWEPAPEEWRDQRLTESATWSAHFGVVPRAVSAVAERWS